MILMPPILGITEEEQETLVVQEEAERHEDVMEADRWEAVLEQDKGEIQAATVLVSEREQEEALLLCGLEMFIGGSIVLPFFWLQVDLLLSLRKLTLQKK